MKHWCILLIAGLALLSCGEQAEENTKKEGYLDGPWLGELALNDSINLNFIFHIANEPGQNRTYLENGGEQIFLETTYKNDSIFMDFPVYQSRIIAKQEDGIMLGYFEKTDSRNYKVPFTASQGFDDRLPNTQPANGELATRYAVSFESDGNISEAVGEFKQIGNVVRGSFLTPYGDYRYLDGKLNGNQLALYGFDGGYLQVFKAELQNDSLANGHYYSGLTGYKTWSGYPSETFQLVDPESMSALNENAGPISFSYPGINGANVEYGQAPSGRVTILQITGSWCPNCKDQAVFLQKLQDAYPEQVNVIGIAFERMGSLDASIAAAKKSKEDLGTNYPVGIAKYNREQVAEEVFPFLKKIRSYPTLIFIDKQGTVRKIYTGFAGPGTTRYEEVSNYLTQFTQDLINE
jgi:thiol-disulfide isomerase/thioredoxin